MTHQEIVLHTKLTALNAIRKLYNPLTKHNFSYYAEDGSAMEQISYKTQYIIEQLEKDLIKLKTRNNETINRNSTESI